MPRRSNQRRKARKRPISKRAQNKAAIKMRSVLGSAIFNAAREKFGENKINTLAETLARHLDEKKRRELRKSRKGNASVALSDVDRKRFKVYKEINYRKPDDVQFFKRKDGRFDKFKGRKRVDIVTAAQKRRFESQAPYRKLVKLVSSTLDVTAKEARAVVKDVAATSRKKLAQFKKTKKFRDMSPRRKRRYNQNNTNVAAMIRLQFALTGDYDPAGIHFQRPDEEIDVVGESE